MRKTNGEDLGFKIFGAVGFLLILIGLWYFYQYAVTQGWIGHAARVAAGVTFSIVIFLVAEWTRRAGYKRYSQLLTGGGIALLYFTTYITYHFEEYRTALGMGLALNSVLLFSVVLLGVWLALRLDSLILTAFTFFLGYAAAYLTGESHQMMISVVLLTAGLTYLNWRKRWDLIAYPVLASYWFLWRFIDENITSGAGFDRSTVAGLTYLVVLFALFSSTAFLKKKSRIPYYILPIVVNVLSLVLGLTIVSGIGHRFRGVFAFALAIANAAAAFVAWRRKSPGLSGTFSLLAIAVFSLGILLQFEKQWMTLAWALEAMILIVTGARYDNRQVRFSGYVVMALTVVRLLVMDLAFLGFPDRFISWTGTLVALSISILVLRKSKVEGIESTFLSAASLVALLLLSYGPYVEFTDRSGILASANENIGTLLLLLFWVAESWGLTTVGISKKSVFLRAAGYAVSAVAVSYYLLALKTMPSSFASISGILLACSCIAASVVLGRASIPKEESRSSLVSGLLGSFLLALVVYHESANPWLMQAVSMNARKAVTSIIWALEALALIFIGFRIREKAYTYCGVILFAITVGKILLSDLSSMESVYRMLVTILVGILALCVSFIYVKNKKTFKKLLNAK